MATSTDRINWTERTLPNTAFWYTHIYGNGVFVALSYGTVISVILRKGFPNMGIWLLEFLRPPKIN